MNILLWVLQVLLGVFSLLGGSYEISNYEKLGTVAALSALPKPLWIAYGALQVLLGFGLFWRKSAPVAATGLSVLSLLGCAMFAQYAGFPGMLWGLVPALLLAFVAYGRHSKKKTR